MEITFGHPKDGRWDLKQFILSMVTNQYGYSIEKLKSNLNFSDRTYFVADSAFFSSENINLLGDRTLWITRVPSTVGEAKQLLNQDIQR